MSASKRPRYLLAAGRLGRRKTARADGITAREGADAAHPQSDRPPIEVGTRVLYWARSYNAIEREYDVERWQGEVQSLHGEPPTHATVLFDGSFFGTDCTRTLPLSQLMLDSDHV